MPRRSLAARIGWTLRDYLKRVWDNSGEDNVFFLAGGIAFNILLAIVPFFLLLLSGLGYLLNQTTAQSSAELWVFIHRLLPAHQETIDSPVHKLLDDIIAQRGSTGLYGLIGFVWFSTRLFGSLRSVLADVFDIEQERGIVEGKVFDIQITIIATVLFAAWTGFTAYLNLATTRGVQALQALRIRSDIMGGLEFWIGSVIAFLFLVTLFFASYKFLPNRRIRWQTALLSGVFTATMFQLAKSVFTRYLQSFNPGSLYTGTLAVIIILVLWTYYAALIFILGGEVGQVYELRRVRRLQRETFEP